MWGCVSKSNTVQRSQSKILWSIANAPWHVTSHNLHTDFNVPYICDVIQERINKHYNNLEAHPNPLLEPLLQPINTRRRKRCWPLDSQDTWGHIAGWIPYHVIVIHGIVACLYYHHISLQIVFFLAANKKYVIFFAFPLQTWLHERSSLLIIRTLPVSLSNVPHIQLAIQCSHNVPFLYVTLPLPFFGRCT